MEPMSTDETAEPAPATPAAPDAPAEQAATPAQPAAEPTRGQDEPAAGDLEPAPATELAPAAEPEPARPLTIAQFTDNYGPAHSGLLYAVQFLEAEILRAGHQVLLVAPEAQGPNPLAGNPMRREIRLPSVPLPGTAIRVWNSRDFSFRFNQLVADPPDVIHVHGLGPTGLLGMWVAQRTGVPLVVTWHTDFEAYAEHYWHLAPFLNAIYKLYQARSEPRLIDKLKVFRWRRPRRGGAQMELLQLCAAMLSEADLVTAPSDKTARRVLEIAPTAVVRVVPNGVAALPPARPIARGPGPRVMYVGRISQEKGIDLLLDAFELVRDRMPKAELMIVGDWHETPVLLRRKLTRAARHGGVTLVGQVPHERLNAYYASADLFAFPSVTDTQALVLHEAAHAGLPFAVVDSELNLVVEPGVNAALARPNAVSFAQAMYGMLQNLDDPGFRIQAAARSRELAAQWSVGRQADEVIGLYDDLAAGREVAGDPRIVPDLQRRPFAGRRVDPALLPDG